MVWTPPPSYTNGQIITQTDLHVGLRDNMRELYHPVAYVEFVGNVTVNTTNPAAPVDVVSSGAVTYAALPTIIEFFSPHVIPNLSGVVDLMLWDGTTDLGVIAVVGAVNYAPAGPVAVGRQLTPTAASHTYKIRAYGSSTTGVVSAGAGGTNTIMPGYIRVWQRGG